MDKKTIYTTRISKKRRENGSNNRSTNGRIRELRGAETGKCFAEETFKSSGHSPSD
jgi:hypothetical protein